MALIPADAAESYTFADFETSLLPLNGYDETYPSQYGGSGSADLSLDTSDARVGDQCLQVDVQSGVFYQQFNPRAIGGPNLQTLPAEHNTGPRSFMRDMLVHLDSSFSWNFGHYNRMEFWIQVPTTGSDLRRDGRENLHVGTYYKRVHNPSGDSDEAGGDHGYHHYNIAPTGAWTKVVVDFHVDHLRSQPGSLDHGVFDEPTGEPGYNYFDCLTRFYVSMQRQPPSVYPSRYRLDGFRIYHNEHDENFEQVHSMTASYVAASGRLIVTWNRHKDANDAKHDIRYAFSDIHNSGWDAATPAPNGLAEPRGNQGYNGMLYETDLIPLDGQQRVFIAIKPQGEDRFTQIELPLQTVEHPLVHSMQVVVEGRCENAQRLFLDGTEVPLQADGRFQLRVPATTDRLELEAESTDGTRSRRIIRVDELSLGSG